jgi:hypothetical protein
MYSTPKNIQTASGAYVQAKGIRTLRFRAEDRGGKFVGEVPNVEWTPDVKVCLLNPGQLFKDGYDVSLAKDGATVIDPNQRTVMQVRERGNVYPFDLLTLESPTAQINYSVETDDELALRLGDDVIAMYTRPGTDLMRWHQRLGHLNMGSIRQLAKGAATGIEVNTDGDHDADCMACMEGKQHWLPFKSGHTHAKRVRELLYIDLAGPMEVTSFDNK